MCTYINTYIQYLECVFSYIPTFIKANMHAYTVASLAAYIHHTYNMDAYIYKYIHTQTLMHVCLHMYIHIYIETCMHTVRQVWLHTCIQTCTLMYVCLHTNLSTCKNKHLCIQLHIHMYIHAYVHTYMETHTCIVQTYSQTDSNVFLPTTIHMYIYIFTSVFSL